MSLLKNVKFAGLEVDEKPTNETKAPIRSSQGLSEVNAAGTSNIRRVTRMFQSNLSYRRPSSIVRPVLRYQPTYRLESSNPFNSLVVEEILEKIVEAEMETRGKIKFDEDSVTLCRSLSEEILSQVKTKQYDRYRIIATVSAGEKHHQSFKQNAKFLWDAEKDAFANYVYERPDLFVIATVYGIYYDWNQNYLCKSFFQTQVKCNKIENFFN